jgi:TatD DNase family protein
MFEPDEVADVLRRAADQGVGVVLTPATGGDDLDRCIVLADEHPGSVWAAVGVHPHEASSLDGELKGRVERALARPGVVAVGEIGLDYHYMNSPREDQLRALAWQLDLALEHDLPVVLHNRESWTDLAAELETRCGALRGVCHSFTEGPAEVAAVLGMGLLVGISGMVTFKQADNIRRMARAVDIDHLLVETDSPFLAPVPFRGRRNEPSYVPYVGARVAEEHAASATELAERSTANFRRLFRLEGGSSDRGEG